MRGLIITFLITLALLLQGCGKGANPSVGGAGGTGSGENQVLYEGNCNLLGKPFGGGDGSSGDPYLICSITHLVNVSDPDYVSNHFVLVKDLNLSGAPMFAISDFSGTFDGNGHVLTELADAQLFASSSGTIKNVTVLNADITGSFFTGILLGWNQAGGLVTNCHVTGALNVGNLSGGLVGRNDGTITKSSANVTLQGIDNLGGLVGLNKGTVTRSFSLGSVVASNPSYGIVGGFVGDNHSGSISDSYSTASAQGKSNVGGFFGQNQATIVNGYSTGAIGGTGANLGGFGGLNTGTVTSSYWNTETSGTVSSSGGTGKTSAEMNLTATFVGWDFSGIWGMAFNAYPFLLN